MHKQLFIFLLDVFILVAFVNGAPSTIDDDDDDFSGKPDSFNKHRHTFQQQMLQAHNKYRTRHCAPPLRLDDKISRSAQDYAQRLADMNRLVSGRNQGLGENLYKMFASYSLSNINGADPTRSWYSGVENYDFNKGDFSMDTGSFTQVVWKETTRLGVGIAWTNDGQSVYIVAQYAPPGNIMGAFRKNVSPALC